MRIIFRLSIILAGFLTAMALGIAATSVGAFYYLQPALPSVTEMREIPLQIPLSIYSRDGRLLDRIGEKRRTPVDFEEIPKIVIEAFLAAEDDRFFEHPGFDYQGIARAAYNLLLTGTRAQGGSTITQQLAREYFLTRERTFIRKAKELILATQIEKEFTKEEIFSSYLNKIFLGQRAYGVAAAASVYFGKSLNNLNIAEAATLAGLPAAPSRYNPVSSPKQATERRSYVLRRMEELKFIDNEELAIAIKTPMMSFLHRPTIDLRAPYITEMVRKEMVEIFGENAYTDGYTAITTIDSRAQRAADSALKKALYSYDRRHGFRGAISKLDISSIISTADNKINVSKIEEENIESMALQNALNQFPSYGYLKPAIVLNINENNSAKFILKNSQSVVLEWNKIRWAPYLDDNSIGRSPKNISQILSPGDVVYLLETKNGFQLAQLPEVQGAFVAINPDDGATIALAGGFDYFANKYNRAIQARRQPGSSFKPFIYSAALENGFTASSIINDAPLVFEGNDGEDSWRPENYSDKYKGPMRMREALVESKNLVSIRILRKMGIKNALNHVQLFGFPEKTLKRDFTLALGSGGASPWEMANGYASLANGGYEVKGYFIDKILNSQGDVIFQANPVSVCKKCEDRWLQEESEKIQSSDKPLNIIDSNQIGISEVPIYSSTLEMGEVAGSWRPDFRETPNFWSNRNQANRIISAENSYIIYDMMRDVIQRGTGRRAKELNRQDLAGKTGTTNGRRDAWFSGFNNEIVAIAWVGFDQDSRSLGNGEEGSRTSLPIWKDFMEVVLENSPEEPLSKPSNIVSVRVAKDTGKLTTSTNKNAFFEIFIAGTEPKQPQRNYNLLDKNVSFEKKEDEESIF
ncbi:MAG: penicillin-binding protein 1A [Pseudomonadota bacterium]|nr:penicillin-binding protein 1A [Pseudomonadota bacterium]